MTRPDPRLIVRVDLARPVLFLEGTAVIKGDLIVPAAGRRAAH